MGVTASARIASGRWRISSTDTTPAGSSTRSSARTARCADTTRRWSRASGVCPQTTSPVASASATGSSTPRASRSRSTATTTASSAPSRWTCAADHPGRRVGATSSGGHQRVTFAQPVPRRPVRRRAGCGQRRGRARAGWSRPRTGSRREAFGIPVPHAARCLVSGVDLVRDRDGTYRVLEDNLRNPSGISYVLENRAAMTRVLPVAFASPARPARRPLRPAAAEAAALVAPPARARIRSRSCSPPGSTTRLLRARLPRPPDGHRAGRGPRPRRRRARRVHAHDPRAASGSTSSTVGSTTTSSTRSCSGRTPARGARAAVRLPRRQRHDRQRGGQRGRRRQGRVRLRPGPDPLLPRRGADPAQRRHLPAVGRRAAGGGPRGASTSWWSSRWRRRGATGC
jgi:hypothetical protein